MRMHHEQQYRAQGAAWVVGVDEVGRGPLAGPVVAAAVVVPDEESLRLQLCAGVRDSKVMTAHQRQGMAALIEAHCRVAVAQASVAEIDAMNIRNASLLAMRRAVAAIAPGDLPPAVLVDGNVRIPHLLAVPQLPVVKGDAVELCIACAAVVAKVHRDALMAELARGFPAYGWEKNAGYGTPEHLAALRVWGVSPHHRTSFAPVRALLQRQVA